MFLRDKENPVPPQPPPKPWGQDHKLKIFILNFSIQVFLLNTAYTDWSWWFLLNVFKSIKMLKFHFLNVKVLH